MFALAPSFPFIPIVPSFPSFPLIDTASFPDAPSFPTLTLSVVTVFVVRLSVFNVLSNLTTTFPFSTIVFTPSPLYSLSAFVPSPTISNVSPNFLAIVVPLFPSKFNPLLTRLVVASCSWEPFIASVDVAFTAPGATLVIFLFPALIPSLVTDIGVAPVADGVIVNPSPFITVLSPAAVLNSADVKPVNSLDSFTLIFPVLSTIAPIFLSDSLVLSAPPTTSNLSFSFLEIVLFAFNGS